MNEWCLFDQAEGGTAVVLCPSLLEVVGSREAVHWAISGYYRIIRIILILLIIDSSFY